MFEVTKQLRGQEVLGVASANTIEAALILLDQRINTSEVVCGVKRALRELGDGHGTGLFWADGFWFYVVEVYDNVAENPVVANDLEV